MIWLVIKWLLDNAKDIDVVMPMYNVIEYNNNYSKTSASLRLYCRGEPALVNDVIVHSPADNNNSASFIYLTLKRLGGRGFNLIPPPL